MPPRRSLPDKTIEGLRGFGVVNPPPIHISSPRFEGTLATLFRCVREHAIELSDVPLGPVCQAYLEYLVAAPEADLDQAATALAILAFLLERKAWQLLPVDDPEPELELPEEAFSLPTVEEYAQAIHALATLGESRNDLFFRTAEPAVSPYEVPFELDSVSAADLTAAFTNLLRRAEPDPVDLPLRPRKSLSEVMVQVLRAIGKDWITLEDAAGPGITRTDAVYWFLAVLELIRLGQLKFKSQEGQVQFAAINKP